MDYIEQQALQYPDMADKYNKLGDLFSRKLWHQLTVALLEFVSDPANAEAGGGLVRLCTEFVANFEAKMNQLRFVQILCAVGKTCSDPLVATQLFETALEKRERLGPEASLLLESELGLLVLRAGKVAEAKEVVEKGKVAVEELESAETAVHSAYYRLSSEYYKTVGPPDSFYRSALMFLAYTPLEGIPQAERYTLATDISLAALTGEGVFNFGEVLATPILSMLDGSPNAWLGSMMQAFNMGDIDAFNKLCAENQETMSAQPALVSRATFTKEKIALLCLMNMVFERHSQDRNIPFEEIAARTKLPVDQVEWLVMRAMSLKLVKGVMDEVERLVHVSWVQPRVLEHSQLARLADRLGEWRGRVDEAHVYVEEQTPELFG
ncbi:26S proteasome subunit like protein [Ectocarpus siliculosus]|uniref:26S proteasome subunit like protein n=1 Tax=Ectocarpus siliculosus TaxID=2880 RepID=D7FUW8_ECTSI|nr:26S proteasome subunit like protein [Ectocarpus siliculosus]|eukprot:CBJ31774.1 26S proteasome subunit like protein [Ectocarpus siliculosus]